MTAKADHRRRAVSITNGHRTGRRRERIEVCETGGSRGPVLTVSRDEQIVNHSMRQAVRGGVSSNGKLFGAAVRKSEQDDEDGDESLHNVP